MSAFPAFSKRGPAIPGPSVAPEAGQVAGWDGTSVVWVDQATGVTDHGALTGLGDDDHPQYALLAGRAGGQTIIGGTGAGDGIMIHQSPFQNQGVTTLGKYSRGAIRQSYGLVTIGSWDSDSYRNIYIDMGGTGQSDIRVTSKGGLQWSSNNIRAEALADTGIFRESPGVSKTTTRELNSALGDHLIAALRLQPHTDATRPVAGVAGRVIYNSDDATLNIDDGTQWRLVDGTIT